MFQWIYSSLALLFYYHILKLNKHARDFKAEFKHSLLIYNQALYISLKSALFFSFPLKSAESAKPH